MAVSTARKEAATPSGEEPTDAGIRISDAATRVGVSARTLRYYEELGLLTPSLYTPGASGGTPLRTWPTWNGSWSCERCWA